MFMAELLYWIILEVASECALPFYYLHFLLLSYRFQHLLSCPLLPLPDVTYHMSHLSNAPHIANSAISSIKSRLSLLSLGLHTCMQWQHLVLITSSLSAVSWLSYSQLLSGYTQHLPLSPHVCSPLWCCTSSSLHFRKQNWCCDQRRED